MSESIRITTLDGTFSAYVARPSVQPAPVIVVCTENLIRVDAVMESPKLAE
jgi:dienelactone hydrolase